MITVRVPGTTANLGPGFDCLGLAFTVYGYFDFEERESGLEFENVAPEFQNEENLAVRGYFRVLEEIGLPPRGLFVRITSAVPISSGLGSSAHLLVAGAFAANASHGFPLDEDAMLRVVTELEGHPDNVAPALLGGLTASMVLDEKVISMRFPVSQRLRFCALIPNFSLSTAVARAALPQQLPFKDAVFNVSRAAVLLKALELGDPEIIAAAMDDRLHQPYRARLIDEYEAVRAKALSCGAEGFCISGAGPTLMAVYLDSEFPKRMEAALKGMRNQWRILPLRVDHGGAVVLKEDV